MTRNRNSRSLLHPIAEIRKIKKSKRWFGKVFNQNTSWIANTWPKKRPILFIENIFILNLALACYNECTRVKFNISIPIQFVLIVPCSMFHIYCQSLVRNKIYLWWGFRGVRPMKRRASIRKTEIRAQNMYKHTECPKKKILSEFYWSTKIQTKMECCGCWDMGMTWECFIRL